MRRARLSPSGEFYTRLQVTLRGGCISSLGNLVQSVPLELFYLHVEKHWMDFDGCVSLSFEE